MQQVGTVGQVWRYIVKSMAGERLPSCRVEFSGLALDRRYAFVQDGLLNNFPWFTARQHPDMLRCVPRVTGGNPNAPDVDVQLPDGRVHGLAGGALRGVFEQAFGKPIHLQCINVGTFDAAPLSLISAATVREIARRAGVAPDALRFRPNVVLAGDADAPFEEDRWVGRVLVLGDAPDAPHMAVQERDGRCRMINLDPHTAQASPEVLQVVKRDLESCAGVYGAVLREGVLREGAPVLLM